MLEGIETGYEEKHDFPHREEPPRSVYMLATVPRTGSTYISHLLWRSGCLGAPLEYLNFLAGSPYAFAHSQPERQKALWRELLHRRTSPNGVFGVKCFSLQLRELQQANPALLLEVFTTVFPKDRPAHVIRLKRRDEVAHAVSYARAALSGVWRKDQEPDATPAVEYSAEAVDHARKLLDRQAADWDLLFRDAGVEPLTIWYEDVLERSGETVQQVASFLGVQLDAAAAVAVPEIEKQSETDSKRWAERLSHGPNSVITSQASSLSFGAERRCKRCRTFSSMSGPRRITPPVWRSAGTTSSTAPTNRITAPAAAARTGTSAG